MEGKGWFIIYGLLLFFAIYLFLSQQQTNSRVNDLRAQVAQLRAQLPTPAVGETPEVAGASPSPDLSTPQARDQQRKLDLTQIKEALAAYQEEQKQYPKELKELQPKYLVTVPQDPLSPKYSYRYRKVGSGFVLTCVLEGKNDPDDVKGSDTKRDQIYTVTERTT